MHRQPYKGCPFECNLAEITWNETVWGMRTNNVKRVYSMKFFEFGPVVQEEMLFKDISNLVLWWPLSSTERYH